MEVIQGHHERTLVVLSVVIACFASYTALDLASRINAGKGRLRYGWILAGAAAMGGGIWAMHFVGILAFRLPVRVEYDITRTLASALVAMAVTGIGLWLIHKLKPQWWVVLASGTIVGIGIASMHYIGMAAMRMPGCIIEYSPSLFVASILIAVAASDAALLLAVSLRQSWQRFVSSCVMGLAIAGMHYTGMAAAQFYKLAGMPPPPAENTMSPEILAILVASITIMLLCLALIATTVDRRFAVSAQREAEALRQARDAAESSNQAKSHFLSMMSHELRTPLNAIIGFAEVLESETFGRHSQPRYKEYARDIRESGIHLLVLVNELLDLSKAEAGKLALHENEMDLTEVLRASINMVRARAETRGVALSSSAPADLPHLYGDELRLKQVLLNLLSNAIKFTDVGGEVTARIDWEQSFLTISIQDTGIGIAPHDLARVVEPFSQADSGFARTQQGTGLGLPLAKSIVELHGGEMEIRSTLGVGTCVEVRLPPERILYRVPPSYSLSAQ